MWSIPGIGERSSASAAMVSRATWWWQDLGCFGRLPPSCNAVSRQGSF